MVQQRAQLVGARRFLAGRPMRVDAEGSVDSGVRSGQLERRATRVNASADGDHSVDAPIAGASEGAGRIVESVEMRMGVDHGRATIVFAAAGR